MGRNYAGVLGPLAFATVAARGLIGGADPKSLLLVASLYLAVFAALGYVVGRLAGWIVEDAVRARLADELNHSDDTSPQTSSGG